MQVWNIILLQPHSIAIVLAYPNAILKQGLLLLLSHSTLLPCMECSL